MYEVIRIHVYMHSNINLFRDTESRVIFAHIMMGDYNNNKLKAEFKLHTGYNKIRAVSL